MLFNSFEFIFLFFPVVIIGYFILGHYGVDRKYMNIWLLLSSLIFYGWSNLSYIVLISSSIAINYSIGQILLKRKRRLILIVGLIFNLGLLGYYKYTDFFIENINLVLQSEYNLLHIILPIGISFFTFQQIAFLVDVYQGKIESIDVFSYGVFISFFPQLIAGPIVHHKEMMPQFQQKEVSKIDYSNISKGLYIFNMGLAKKIIIADTFGKIASVGYANTELLTGVEGWVTSLAYSVQLYFDFSGYSDMAIGLGLMFNIRLPQNFSSPYKSKNIQDFWRNWHMTLSKFLRDYVYIPLGGNRNGKFKTRLNLLLTFIIGGIWHGAGWTFIFWGVLHGSALIANNIFQNNSKKRFPIFGTILTFLFVNAAWVFFRADSWTDAINVLKAMTFLQNPVNDFLLVFSFYDLPIWIIGAFLMFAPNTNELGSRFKLSHRYLLVLIALIFINLVFLNSSIKQEFLYFDF